MLCFPEKKNKIFKILGKSIYIFEKADDIGDVRQ